MKTRICFLLSGTALSAVYLAPFGVAQGGTDWFDRSPVQPVSEQTDPTTEPVPIANGGIDLSPEVVFETGLNSNVLATDLNEIDDSYVGFTPSITMNSNWRRHALDGYFGVEHVHYSELTDERHTDLKVKLRGRLDLGEQTSVTLGVSGADETEDRTALSNVPLSTEPNEYTRIGGVFGFSHQAGRFITTASLAVDSFDHDDVEIAGALIQDQDFRDHDELTGSARVAYAVNRNVALYTSVDHIEADFRPPNIFNAFNRDYSGTVLLLGTDFDLNNTISGDVGLGYQSYTYDDPSFEDISDFAFAGNVDWQVANATTLSAAAARRVIDPGLILTNAAIETGASLRLEQGVSKKFSLNGEAGYAQYEFELIDRDDDRLDLKLGANWKLNPNIWLEGGYQISDQTSDFQAFTDNRVVLKMRVFP